MIDFDYIDHVAYAFCAIEDGYRFFESHRGFRLLKGPGINTTQGVRFLFVKVDGIGTIEILSPINSSIPSPLSNQLTTSGPGFNHICYAVSDMESSIPLLLEEDWKVVCNPVPDIAFNGRRISFLSHKNFGLIELLDSKFNFVAPMNEDNNFSTNDNLGSFGTTFAIHDGVSTSPAEVPSKIIELINKSLDNGAVSNDITSFEEIDQWDSLSQAIFHSLFESLVETRLDPSDFYCLEIYIKFLDGLK